MSADRSGIIGAKLEVRALVKDFGLVRAVDALSFSAEPGSFVTLLGPSGSGKTTTLNIIAGFESPTSGEVVLGSKPITASPTYKRNIGMVFQNYALFPHMTVAQNVAYPLQMRGVKKNRIAQKVRDALGMVQLAGYEKRYPKQLSGGQQQRVGIARVLVFNPPLMLMDEPLGALDKKLREQMQIEIKRIQNRTGITVIYVTHDQEEALVMSDQIIILNAGKLQQVGNPSAIYDNPRNRFVAEFIGETNLFEGQILQENDEPVMALYELGVKLKLPSQMRSAEGKKHVSIRPEMLWLEHKPSGPGSLTGRIEEVIYVGESTKFIVKVLNRDVLVKQPRRTDPGNFKKGDHVTVRFHVDDMVCIKNDVQ